ncbi:MAG: hypothetical protein ABIT36_04590 [Steroidobacteraceae bacterium]
MKIPAPPQLKKTANSWWQRFAGRVRNGLLAQEIIDRFSKMRLLCQPYIVTFEAHGLAPQTPTPAGCSLRLLTREDAKQMRAIGDRLGTEEQIRTDLETLRCYGAFRGPLLIGCTWVNLRSVPLIYRGGVLFEIQDDEAYLFNMHIDPAHRGLRVAPWLRAQVLAVLAAEGRVRCYSLSMLGNRSSRIFKARLGAQEREWRLSLHIGFGPLPGLDLRLSRRGAPLRTRMWHRRPAWSST